jgi:hypothetical protein
MAIYQRNSLLRIVNTCKPFLERPRKDGEREILTHVLFASGWRMRSTYS